jgi:hypothetical protein
MTQAEIDEYWAQREEDERLARIRESRREHVKHQLGVALIWLASVAFAFVVGYSQHRNIGSTAALIWVWAVMGGFFGGLALISTNRHRRDQDRS